MSDLSRRQSIGWLAGVALGSGLPTSVWSVDVGDRTGGVTFATIADVQYRDGPTKGTRFYRESLAKLDACVADLNTHELDFVVHLGDFIDGDFTSFDAPLAILAKSRAPVHHVLGNHDFAVDDQLKAQVPSKLGLASRYYDFVVGAYRFVALDGNDVSVLATVAGTPERERADVMLRELTKRKSRSAKPWNGAVGDTQLAWLDKTLSDADEKGQKSIVFCHFPVLPEAGHNLWNDRAVRDVLDKHKSLIAYMNGHNHHGAYAERGGVHYVTVRGMVETADTTAYAAMSVDGKILNEDGTGREPDRRLEL